MEQSEEHFVVKFKGHEAIYCECTKLFPTRQNWELLFFQVVMHWRTAWKPTWKMDDRWNTSDKLTHVNRMFKVSQCKWLASDAAGKGKQGNTE